MANEIQYHVSLAASKSGASINSVSAGTPALLQANLSGNDMAQQSQLISTSGEALEIPADVSPIGLLMIKNCDAANYIELSTTTGSGFADGRFAKLRAGKAMIFQPWATPIYALANTAAVRIFFAAVEE